MSTMSLRWLLEQIASMAPGTPLSPEEIAKARSALKELEAIERAAVVIDENVKIPAIPAELEPALRLMEAIAKGRTPARRARSRHRMSCRPQNRRDAGMME